MQEIRWYAASKFTCYWRIQAPADYYIGVKLENMEGFKCEQACYSFIEIKYGNLENSGMIRIFIKTFCLKYQIPQNIKFFKTSNISKHQIFKMFRAFFILFIYA